MRHRRRIRWQEMLLLLAVVAAAAWSARGPAQRTARTWRSLAEGEPGAVRCILDDRARRVGYESDGLRITADLYEPETANGSPAVLLLHGSAEEGRRAPLVRALAERLRLRGYTVLAPDARAYGRSEDPAAMSPEAFDFAADVAAALEYLRAATPVAQDRIHLVGHSFGGSVALAAAARYDGIASVVAFGPSRRIRERFLDEGAPDRAYFLERWQHDMALEDPLDFAVWREVRDQIDIERNIEHFEEPGHMPLLLIDAEREDAADLAFLRDLAGRAVPPVEYWTVPATGHYLHTAAIGGAACYNTRVVEGFVDRVDTWLRTRR